MRHVHAVVGKKQETSDKIWIKVTKTIKTCHFKGYYSALGLGRKIN